MKQKCILFLILLHMILPVVGAAANRHENIPGNPDYSRQNIFIFQQFRTGYYGAKDHLYEDFLAAYRFKSENTHAFSIMAYHIGFGAGLYSRNLDKFHAAGLLGFEYLYKVFNSQSGVFIFTDIGICNLGFALNTGAGIGDRYNNGFILQFTYLLHTNFFTVLDFHMVVLKYLALRIEMGFDLEFSDTGILLFGFYNGIFPGIAINKTGKIELGGGFTMDDNYIFRWYAGANIVLYINF